MAPSVLLISMDDSSTQYDALFFVYALQLALSREKWI